MTPNDWITVITTVGFPIVMCGAMGWYVKDQSDKHRDEFTSERASHQEQVSTLAEVIHNNTLAIQKLTDYIERK